MISQEQYVKQLLDRFSMTECNPKTTPMSPNSRLLKSDCPAPGTGDKKLIRKYQQLVGAFLYLSSWTRPDIAFVVNQCAKFMSNPGPSHLSAAKRILQYLKGTAHLCITYCQQDSEDNWHMANLMWGYADADHTGDPESRKSVTGYVMLLNGGAVLWSSTCQVIVALSSSEAEFYATSAAGQDVCYLRMLMDQLGCVQIQPTLVFEDNWSCIYLSWNSTMYKKSKLIDVRVYHLRNLCNDGTMTLEKVTTGEQAADTFTKALPQTAFEMHCETMMGKPLPRTVAVVGLTLHALSMPNHKCKSRL